MITNCDIHTITAKKRAMVEGKNGEERICIRQEFMGDHSENYEKKLRPEG